MKIRHEVLSVSTQERFQFIDLTQRARDLVQRENLRHGLIVLQALHTTTGLFIDEWQGALLRDLRRLLEELVQERQGYRHDDPRYSDCDRRNTHAHLRSILLGGQLVVPVVDGDMTLGTTQAIIFAELDGPRSRQIALEVVGE
jgi:secondary thiamine-phosphate synthase enzyme